MLMLEVVAKLSARDSVPDAGRKVFSGGSHAAAIETESGPEDAIRVVERGATRLAGEAFQI